MTLGFPRGRNSPRVIRPRLGHPRRRTACDRNAIVAPPTVKEVAMIAGRPGEKSQRSLLAGKENAPITERSETIFQPMTQLSHATERGPLGTKRYARGAIGDYPYYSGGFS